MRIGDWVEVIRAGEVIPKIVGPIRDRRDGSEQPWTPPERCPACGTVAVRYPDEVMRYCPNPLCPGRVLEGIIHFASRDAMDIRGLGEERVRQLVAAGLVNSVADLYTIGAAQLVELDRFARQSAEQLVNAIAGSKAQPLSLLLYGLGIRHVGKTVALGLARHFGSIQQLRDAPEPAIAAVNGVGPTIAAAVRAWFDDPRGAELVDRLIALGLTVTEPQRDQGGGPLSGRTYVLTGSLPTLTRGEAAAKIEAAGGTVAASVSKKTSTVVAGDDAGAKLDRARTLGVEVIDEAELLRRIDGST